MDLILDMSQNGLDTTSISSTPAGSSVSGLGSPNAAEPAITYKPILDDKRCMANRRERERVDALRKEFTSLRGVVPKDVAEPELTRIDVVRRASEYIDYLSGLLQADDGGDASVQHEDNLENDELRSSFICYKVEENTTQILPEKRVICNARARNRSKRTKEAFDSLKTLIPIHRSEPELSRMDLLRRATEYIAVMQKMLQDDEDKASSSNTSGSDGSASNAVTPAAPSPTAAVPAMVPGVPDDSAAHIGVCPLPSPLSIDLQCTSILTEPVDSDYGTMSPPASANSECSFTFPAPRDSTVTTGSCTTTSTSCLQTSISSGFSQSQPSAISQPPHGYQRQPMLDLSAGGGCLRSRRASQLARASAMPYAVPRTFGAPTHAPLLSCAAADLSVFRTTGSPLPPVTPLTPITPLTRIYYNLVASNQVAWSPRLASRVLGNAFQPSPPPPMTPAPGSGDKLGEISTVELERFLAEQPSSFSSRHPAPGSMAWPRLASSSNNAFFC